MRQNKEDKEKFKKLLQQQTQNNNNQSSENSLNLNLLPINSFLNSRLFETNQSYQFGVNEKNEPIYKPDHDYFIGVPDKDKVSNDPNLLNLQEYKDALANSSAYKSFLGNALKQNQQKQQTPLFIEQQKNNKNDSSLNKYSRPSTRLFTNQQDQLNSQQQLNKQQQLNSQLFNNKNQLNQQQNSQQQFKK